MSWLLGELVPIHLELTVDNVDEDAPTIGVIVVKPDGTSTDPLTPEHDGAGNYDLLYDTTSQLAGRYTWIATVSGGITAVASGVFDVIDPAATGPTLTGVQPWTDAAAIRARPGCDAIDARKLVDAVLVATDLLYAMSGRQFSGRLEETVRPTARRPVSYRNAAWLPTWGTCGYAYAVGYGVAALNSWLGHSCHCRPREIELPGYPVTAIIGVKIDGETIPDDEYRVDDNRLLVRMKPTADAIPTVRPGWPTCQRLDLPDTEVGTFSVHFAYGSAPPQSGVLAATILAAEIALAFDPTSSSTRLPERVRAIVRQGESVTMVDPQDVLDKNRTGIPEVDLFLKAFNPQGMQRRAQVWSPDLARSRRQTS